MKLPQLSLRDLFWLVLVVAIALGAYRWGSNIGFEAGKRELDRTKVTVRQHYVPFVTNDSDQLIRLVKSSAAPPDVWALDQASIDYHEASQSLVVSATGDVHKRVAGIVKSIAGVDREARKSGKSWRDVVPPP